MRKKIITIGLCVFLVGAGLIGCAGMMTKPTEQNFKSPVVTLDHVELPSYFGYWFYNAKVAPTNGKAGNNGSPLMLAFIFNVENPNTFPVQMNDLKFTVALEDFELNTVNSMETMWIPPGKTNQLRVNCVLGVWEAFMSLGVTGGFKMKEMNVKPFDLIEKWWTKAPEFSFPVDVRDGAAIFKADGIIKVSSFKATFP